MFRTTGTKVLAGYLDIATSSDHGELIHVPYPFEIFVSTPLVDQETLNKETESASGLRVLDFEALKKQYEVIHDFDGRVERAAKKVIEFLSDKQVRDALGGYIESRHAR